MYGETSLMRFIRRAGSGLSPHVRGNQPARPAGRGGQGSIPACTGKPIVHDERADTFEVYPRMYGETIGLLSD